jgi:Flp pilus assembly protein TadB
MRKRQPVPPPPFWFDNPRTDDEMLAQLAAHLAVLGTGFKTGKKRERALKKFEEEELPAALVAINKPAFLAGHVFCQAMNLLAAFATEQLGAEPPPWWDEPQESESLLRIRDD